MGVRDLIINYYHCHLLFIVFVAFFIVSVVSYFAPRYVHFGTRCEIMLSNLVKPLIERCLSQSAVESKHHQKSSFMGKFEALNRMKS